jgi:predicted RNA methylase
MGSAEAGYQLDSDAAELERLDLQGRVLAPATRTILQMAGVRRDMRVLDLGSGAGMWRSPPPG